MEVKSLVSLITHNCELVASHFLCTVPPIDSIYSNFIDVNNPNNTDPANLARIDVLKALRPGVSLDSVQRLYTRTQEQTVFLTSQNLFKTSTSIGGQYVCRATNSIGVRSTTFNITVAREYYIRYINLFEQIIVHM